MPTPIVLLALLPCLLLSLYLSRRHSAWQRGNAPWPLYARKPRQSPRQLLHQRLVEALPGRIVLADVALADVLGVRRGFEQRTWARRLRHLQYDFVVCAKDGTVLGAIALDSTAQAHTHRKPSDSVTERASAAAGLRLLHWPVGALPDVAALRAEFGDLDMAFFEEKASSANASWWPSIARDRHPPSSSG